MNSGEVVNLAVIIKCKHRLGNTEKSETFWVVK